MKTLDWMVLAAYTGVMIFVGYWASRGSKSGDSHLRASRSLPAWAVVFSVLATEVSAATYIGVPEQGFRGGWTYLQYAIGALLAKVVLAFVVLPLYWRLNLETVYGFLGQRIGPLTQKAAAVAFLVGRLVASGVRLFIAALAFCTVTKTELHHAILLMAGISTVYTLLGGLKAVVWTDVLQGTIFAVGALTAIWFGLSEAGLSLGELFSRAHDAGKLEVIRLQDPKLPWYLSTSTLFSAVFGAMCLGLATHGTDQENVQHLLNTKSAKASRWSIVTSGVFTFPIVALFLTVGTVLWAFHLERPQTAYDLTVDADIKRIFPNFIVHVMPAGLRGLVFAGLFAAAISSLGATLNATSATWLKDIRPPRKGEVSLLRVRLQNLVFGVCLAGVGLFFAARDGNSAQSLIDTALSAMTMIYGGILGIFLIGLLFRRCPTDHSGLIALGVGVYSGIFLFFHKDWLKLEQPWFAWTYNIPVSVSLTLIVAALLPKAPAAPKLART